MKAFTNWLNCMKDDKKSMAKIARPIIQGGMGVGVSGWRLARASAIAGAIGTVSGTAVANLLAVALQKGDPGRYFRRALKHFPFPAIAKIVLDEYYVKGGVAIGHDLKEIPMWSLTPPRKLIALTICANFAFVWLAKEGHRNAIFINYLEKIQLPHIYSILGAMLANVDGVVMGAGLPRHIPKVIDDILEGSEASYPIDITNLPAELKAKYGYMRFNPIEFFGEKLPKMTRPLFLPIVSSHTLAKKMLDWCAGKIDGFVVEDDEAGGHNAPPRGELTLNEDGEPIYGDRDKIKPAEFVKIGLPFWLAGSFGSPGGLMKAKSLGASGIQAGSVFAYCVESGIVEGLKRKVLTKIYRDHENVKVHTSPIASPTGFPFKIFCLFGTLSDKGLYSERKRSCSLGYLRELVWDNRKVIFRCKAEPASEYVRKGGKDEETEGCMCICAGLCATVGARDGEIPLLTTGDDLDPIYACIEKSRRHSSLYSYSAKDAVHYILGK